MLSFKPTVATCLTPRLWLHKISDQNINLVNNAGDVRTQEERGYAPLQLYPATLASSAELTICVWYAAVTIAMAATFHKVAFSCGF